jgi:hypothetical protein
MVCASPHIAGPIELILLVASIKTKAYYRPLATRTEYLVVLLTFTLIFIALIEYACHVMPQHKGFGELPNELLNDTASSASVSRDALATKAEVNLMSRRVTLVRYLNTALARNISGGTTQKVNSTSIRDTSTVQSATVASRTGSYYPSSIEMSTSEGTYMSIDVLSTSASSQRGTYMSPGSPGMFDPCQHSNPASEHLQFMGIHTHACR